MFSKYTDESTYQKIVSYDSVSQMWKSCQKQYGNEIAINDNGQNYSYCEIENDVAYFRTTLVENGVGYGDRVGIFIPNSYDFVKAFIAITTLGAVAVLLPAHLDEKSVFGISFKFNLTALVYSAPLKEKLSVLSSQRPTFPVIDVTKNGESKTESVTVKKEDACAVLFTGGTTGKSKGALLSNEAVMQGTKNGCYGYKDVFNQRYFLVLPLTHVFGLIRNLMTSLYTGSNLHICRNNKEMFKEIAVFKPTIMVLVPALAEMALNLSKQLNRNMLGDSLKCIICGAATVPPYLVREYKKIDINLLPGYGLTESANLVSGNPESERKPESVGIPYPEQELKVVNGELWLKGKNMMMGYVGDEQENATAYEDGWFKTGDLVRFDEEGYMYIVGRIKEVIVLSSGENISPAELEAKFAEIDVIQDCLIYDTTENGKQILALEVLPRQVVLAKVDCPDKQQYLLDKINEVNKNLPNFEKISKIIIRDTDFMRSPSMKILRKQH